MDNNDQKPIKFNIKDMGEDLLNLIPDMILVKGEQSHILWANKSFRDYYGMTNEQLQGIIDSPKNNPDNTQQYIKDDTYVFTTGKMLDIPEEPVVRFDGVVEYFHTIKSAFKDASGKVIMTIGISRNVTENRKHRNTLEEMNKFMVGREIKMVELKKRIKELEK